MTTNSYRPFLHSGSPLALALRGGLYSCVTIVVFCAVAGIDRMQHFSAYASAVGATFVVHLIHALGVQADNKGAPDA
jgi:hypothetical protein